MNELEMQAELERLRAPANRKRFAEEQRQGRSQLEGERERRGVFVRHGRFPVTLYKEQWLRILSKAPEIETFIRENVSKLKTKE